MIYSFEKETGSELQRGHLCLGGSYGDIRIDVNNHYLEKNGECWVPVMGEFHYARVRHESWKDELLKMKAGGITMVSTYVFWLFHEEEEGVFNFSGDYDIRYFLEMVKECGLDAVLRIGPWCHAELRNGGFPDWLLEKECITRTDDPVYLAYVSRYWRKLSDQVADFLFKNGGPVSVIQLENELTDNARHLETLKGLAIQSGLEAPLYTVTGWNATYGAAIPEYDVLPVFGGYADAPWENHTRQLEPVTHYFFLPARNDHSIGKDLIIAKQPAPGVFQMRYDMYPFATCELGAGIQVTHHRRPLLSADDVAALAMVKLGCGNNLPGYYMYHGGTNPLGKNHTMQESRATGYPNDVPVRSYDFQAPLGEFGQINPQYYKLKTQHLFLNSYGTVMGKMKALFQSTPVQSRDDTTSLRYALRTDNVSGFVFVNNYQRHGQMASHENVQFEVPVRGGTMVFPDTGIDIAPGNYFFLPYNLKTGGVTLKYSTTQLVCKTGNTLFFMAIDGISAEYVWDNGGRYKIKPGFESKFTVSSGERVVNIITLTQHQAENLYVIDGHVFYSESGLFLDKNRLTLYSKGHHELSWSWWDGSIFLRQNYTKKILSTVVDYKCAEIDLPAAAGSEELLLSKTDNIRIWSLSVAEVDIDDNIDALLLIDYTGDMAQIYVGDVLIADDFYKGVPWEVSIKRIREYDGDVMLLISEKKDDDIYLEVGERVGLALRRIDLEVVYSEKVDISQICIL